MHRSAGGGSFEIRKNSHIGKKKKTKQKKQKRKRRRETRGAVSLSPFCSSGRGPAVNLCAESTKLCCNIADTCQYVTEHAERPIDSVCVCVCVATNRKIIIHGERRKFLTGKEGV